MGYLFQKDFGHRTGLLQGEASVQCDNIQIMIKLYLYLLDR